MSSTLTIARIMREVMATDPTDEGRDGLHAWLLEHAPNIARAFRTDVGNVRAVLADGKTWGRDQPGPAFVSRVRESLQREAKRQRTNDREKADREAQASFDAMGQTLRADPLWASFGRIPVGVLLGLAQEAGTGTTIAIVHADGAYQVDASKVRRACVPTRAPTSRATRSYGAGKVAGSVSRRARAPERIPGLISCSTWDTSPPVSRARRSSNARPSSFRQRYFPGRLRADETRC